MIAALGLLIGILAGLVFAPDVPLSLQNYLPIAVVAALDAVFGGLRAYLDGIFDDKVFVVSFVSNVVIAAAIVYLGDQLGVGRPAHHGRRRRARHPHLLQRRRHPAATSSMPEQEPAPTRKDADPARGATACAARCPSPSRRQAVVAVLLAVLGFAVVVQVGTPSQRHLLRAARERADRGARRPDRHRRAGAPRGRAPREHAATSCATRATRRSAALDEAEQRVRTLNIIAGLVPVTGPGPAGDDHGVDDPRQRRAPCSTPCRSCARRVPRRWSSTTPSGSAPTAPSRTRSAASSSTASCSSRPTSSR